MASDPRDQGDELDEGPDESDINRTDENDVDRCPNCGGTIYEDTDRCPKCGHYVTMVVGRGSRIGAWIVLAFLLALIAIVIYALVR